MCVQNVQRAHEIIEQNSQCTKHIMRMLSFQSQDHIVSYVYSYLKVNWSPQAIRIFSTVAGLLKAKFPVSPASFRAADTASLMAKSTDAAKNSGGSPIACKCFKYIDKECIQV